MGVVRGRVLRPFVALAAMALSIALAGCATQLTLAYTCSPDGASLTQDDGREIGPCPGQYVYPLTSTDRSRGYAVLKGIRVKWASGATASVGTITAFLKNGTTQTYHFDRPASAPNVEYDNKIAVQFDQQLREIQEANAKAATEAQAQQAADNQAAFAALFCALASARTSQPLTTNLNCQTAYMRGSTAQASTSPGQQCARTGQAYDPASGNSYRCSQVGNELMLTGSNAANGTQWTTYYSGSGDMRGVDANGHSWTYTASTTVYYNYGTGQRCVGTGAAQTCTP